MSKPTHRRVKFTPEEMAHELPDEIDVAKLRSVGRGAETVRMLAERSKRVVGLDPDVAKVFRNADQVNKTLRKVIELGNVTSGKKSA
jgi:hypothetical protein